MSKRRILTALVVAASAGGFALPAHATPSGDVVLVCSGTAGCPATPRGTPVYRTLGEGVSHAKNGDYVLVWPGRYREAVSIASRPGLTGNLHIRGMNRNGVVLDGTGQSGSGIHISGMSNTWVENMTAQNYQTGSKNGFYWTQADGFWGRYLTAYNNGDYGVYAFDSTSTGKTPSAFAYVYGSWNADSGIYVGGCRDCNTVVTNSRAYKNAIGYSGTNAGGELYLVNSEWDHNASGLVPNSLQSEPDMPQQSTYIVGNYIHDNNDTDVPGAGITAIAPVGMGVDIAGGWNNIVRGNLIRNQKHAGVNLHWLFMPPVGNQVIANTFDNTAFAAGVGDADIAVDGTGVQNCAHGNTHAGGKPVTFDPPNLAGMSDCGSENPGRANLGEGLYTPGDPVVSVMTALNAAGVTESKHYKGPGPHPDAQRTMPNPCQGLPANPWCRGGKPVVAPPSAPAQAR